MDPLDQLRAHLSERPDAPLPPSLIASLRPMLDAHNHGVPLPCLLRQDARRRRDGALRRAAELLAPNGGAWSQAGAVLKALTRFERRTRPAQTDLEHALRAALDAGAVPRSQQRIYKIIRPTSA